MSLSDVNRAFHASYLLIFKKPEDFFKEFKRQKRNDTKISIAQDKRIECIFLKIK